MKNIPYKKVYNEDGECINPITKQNPYISIGSFLTPDGKRIHFPTRHQRHRKVRLSNNRKSTAGRNWVQHVNGKVIKHKAFVETKN